MCDICQKKYKSRSGLKRHQFVHNNNINKDKESLPKKSTIKKVLSKEKMDTFIEEMRITVIENACYPDMVSTGRPGNVQGTLKCNAFFPLEVPLARPQGNHGSSTGRFNLVRNVRGTFSGFLILD